MSDAFLNFQMKFALGAKVRERLYRKLAQLMHNGVSLDRSLEQLYFLESKNGKKETPLSLVYRRWRKSLNNGLNFGACVAPFVPASEAMLIETGSDSGFLEKALTNAANAVAQQKRVKSAIVGSAAYPVLLLLMLMAALWLASTNIIPAFVEVLPLHKWPPFASTVADVCFFIQRNGLYMVLGIVALFTVVGWSLPRWTGRSRMSVENMVPWNIYRMWQGSSFLLSVASLMTAGVKIDNNSLARLGRNTSPYLQERIRGIARQASSGLNLGEALASAGYNFPEEEIIADIRIYATLKGFEDNLISITTEWVDDVEEKVKVAMKILNFIALFLIAFTIGSLISSLFSVMQNVQDASSM